MRFFYTTCFFTALLLVSACRDQSLLEAPEVVHLDAEFSLDLFEQRDPTTGEPTFGLWVETLGDCACSGCTVVADARLQGSTIAVEIMGIQEPMPCVGGPAPARTFVPIGRLQEGQYTLSVALRSVATSIGTLTVNADQYALTMSDPQGFEVRNYSVRPLPPALVWGYAHTADEPSILLNQQWVADLKQISSDPGLAPGFYSYFTVSGNGAMYFHSSMAPQGPVQMFVRRLDASLPTLLQTLQVYRSQSLSVRCLSTWGEL